MKWYILLLLCVVLVVYLVIGAVVFHYLEFIESPGGNGKVRNITAQILERCPSISESDVEEFVLLHIKGYDRGVVELGNLTSETVWALDKSIMLSVIIVTTIGYGNMYPVTKAGHAFCSLYALIGFPLCLKVLAGIGQRLQGLFGVFDGRLATTISSERLRHTLKFLAIVLLGCVFFLLVPALAFTYAEDWNFAEGLYYCFITLTTVGFGDYAPNKITVDKLQNRLAPPVRAAYRFLISLWIFVGLAWVAGVIRLIQARYTVVMESAERTIVSARKASVQFFNENGFLQIEADDEDEDRNRSHRPSLSDEVATIM